ncbi:dentin sialophosphoprotein-like [Mizuhopecten yessoensis]|uniref:Tantalus-like domain-containing protein n=1 Tax=Mizuhopecten yessoensis TaxID=6573 RepID=A0A210Q1Q7_MIZYE|nr:dentin sialophosphoprotein-like [Mizuhopecten yessoensis]OWF42678.1 hypothetical protein KP79_PYT15757 [Mizuhopecten yessoensis]
MELDLLETPGTKQATKSKKRRSIRIRRKSHLLGFGPVCDEDKTDDILPVESHSQDVNISALASDVGQICEENNLQASGNQFGSVWMDTDSPEMAELVIRRNRRKSCVHLPMVSVIDGIDSPSVLTDVDTDLNMNDHHLSVELSRTGDMSDSIETNGMGSRLSGSYIVTQSPLVDTSGTSGSGHIDLRFNQQQENDCSSAGNSFSEYLPSDNSTASLSPCFEARDYNVGGKTFQYFNSGPQQTQDSSDSCKVSRINSTESSTQNRGSGQMVLSLVEENRTLLGTTQDLTSRMTPVDKKSGVASDLISSLTPYSPSQPIFKNISPPNCESPNSTFSPVYLTPSDKITRSKVNLDAGNDDEDVWKTCKKTIVPETDGHVGVTPGTVTNIKTKALKSTQKKSSRSNSKSSSEVPSKQQTSGFLSICRSLAGKLANAVRNSPDNERSNTMSSSDGSFTSIKPTNTSNEIAEVMMNSSGKNLGSVVTVSTVDNSDTGIKVSTPVNSNLLSLTDGTNLSSAFSYERKSGQTLHFSDSMKPSLPLSQDKVDDTCFCASEKPGSSRPVQDSELVPVPEVVTTNGEKLTNTSDTQTNHELCSTTDIDTTSEAAKSDSEDAEVIQVSNRPAMRTISQSQAPKCSDEAIAQHLEVCFDYLDSEPIQETHNKYTAESGTQNGHHVAKSISLESAELSTVVENLDTVDITSRADPDKVRKVKAKQKRTGRKSMGLVSQESPGCELSESVNKLSLNTVFDMDTCIHVVPKDSHTDSGIKQKESESANVSGEFKSSAGCEPIPPCVESDLMSSLPSVNEVKKSGHPKKSKKVSDKTTALSGEPIPSCVEIDPLPSVSVVKKRSRSRKSMSLIPPVVVEEVSNVLLSSQPGAELQKTSLPQLVNNKTGEDSASLQNETSDCKQKSIDNIKVLTAEDLKSLDEYLGIEDMEPVIVPPPKKRGRPRKSVDGRVQMQTKAAYIEAADKNLFSVDKSVSWTKEQEVNVSQKEESGMTDVQTIVKDPLVAELEDLELLERPKRKSSRIQRRSIEIYRQIQTANTAEEDVPMSPLETVEESKQTAAVLQDVSSNHGNTRNNQDSTTKIARKRKLTKNEPSVEDIYKNKNFKRPAPKIWETIYETPAEEQLFSKKRFRRAIMFDEGLIVPPAKTKMRLRKAVKNGMDPRQRRRKMLSDLAVKKKLAKMEAVLEDDD